MLLPGFAAQTTFHVCSTCAIIASPAFRLTASGIDEVPINAQGSELIDNRNQSTLSTTLPRRQFLKLMTATSAAVFLPGHLVASDLSYPHRPPKSQIRSKNLGSTSRQDDALRVMTYNVWGIPTSKDRAARMVAIGRKLATMNLDIVGLQECWLEADRDRIVMGLAGSDLRYIHFYPSGLMGSGLMLLSRFPIVDVGFHRFSLNGLPLKVPEVDYYGGKGIGYACLNTPYGEIAVFNTHIIARYADDEDDIFRAHRAAQAYEFARYINAYAKQRPVIAMGDFNVNPGGVGYQLVSVLSGLSNCYEAVHGSDPPFTGFIDHVFVRSGKIRGLLAVKAERAMHRSSEEIGLERLSDHDAVLVELDPSATALDTAPTQEKRTEVLRNLLCILEQGIADAITRSRGHDAKAGLSFGAFIGAEAASEKLPAHRLFWRRALRYSGMLIALPVAIAQAWLGRIVTQEEINTLYGLAQEVGVQLGYQPDKSLADIIRLNRNAHAGRLYWPLTKKLGMNADDESSYSYRTG